MEYFSFADFFMEPLLVSSTFGCILMGLSSAVVGALLFVQKEVLIGEALSHASYPGIIGFLMIFSAWLQNMPELFPPIAFLGAFTSSIIGMYVIKFMISHLNTSSDTSLTFVLSTSLGMGVLLVSRIQFVQPAMYQQVISFLYGQASTILWVHVWFYAILTLFIVCFVYIFFETIKAITFDRECSYLLGLRMKLVSYGLSLLTVISVIIGMQSIGILLMVGMFVAPPTVGRNFTNKLSSMLIVSSCIGVFSAFFGYYTSVNFSIFLENHGYSLYLPTGPSIIFIAFFLALFSAIFSRGGLLSRFFKRRVFMIKVRFENSLKSFSRGGALGFHDLVVLYCLGCIKKGKQWEFTSKGEKVANDVIRKHRLWESYLFEYGVMGDMIHMDAEEMEHVLTDDLERRLVKELKNPKKDPHNKRIPDL